MKEGDKITLILMRPKMLWKQRRLLKKKEKEPKLHKTRSLRKF
jgi:hypothetical protein